jgi:Xaa-Pro dipeptidase
MDTEDRLAAICRRMREDKLEVLIGLHDGAHFIEKPNPVMVLCGYKSLGPAAAMLRADGRSDLVVTPAWDAPRAVDDHPGLRVIGTDDLADGIRMPLRSLREERAIGLVGLSAMPSHIASRITFALPHARPVDDLLFKAAGIKTDTEIERAREAARIAERGYRRLLDIARPGATEDDLAVELKWYMKSLGAEDSFLLLCASPHNRGVQPSTGRRLQRGDVILAEIAPSYHGQLVKICRTVSIGPPSSDLVRKYGVLVDALDRGVAAAVAGAPVSQVWRAIDVAFDSAGYGEYGRPPHTRRRGHGLGFGAIAPGDVTSDNATILEPDMLLTIQSSQYMPDVGYLACGDPVVMTARGASLLTPARPSLATIGT